ncbi:hypothetical protein [Flavobacterium sp. W21_SRS_FM6]|uniref:hypothetical protein n=1 Tax=Flavobacterium sp. W21_SRS_FM6 TaxID=3240268 RepID=UPI003F8F0B7B
MKGQVKVITKGQIIVSHVKGQWSLQTALRNEEELHRAVLALKPGTTHAHMIFFDEWELHTPEATPVIERTFKWCAGNGMTHAAEILEYDALKEFILQQAIHEKKGHVQIQRFDNEADALSWLIRAGFACQSTSLLKLI